eukprot:GDKH01009889.1.p1 GENE.GDKH01009889.1~~GDKH01009889.1.p1  ORF type:complete len:331 (+),score=42.00 GDKH01009889.1:132-1124(+)
MAKRARDEEGDMVAKVPKCNDGSVGVSAPRSAEEADPLCASVFDGARLEVRWIVSDGADEEDDTKENVESTDCDAKETTTTVWWPCTVRNFDSDGYSLEDGYVRASDGLWRDETGRRLWTLVYDPLDMNSVLAKQKQKILPAAPTEPPHPAGPSSATGSDVPNAPPADPDSVEKRTVIVVPAQRGGGCTKTRSVRLVDLEEDTDDTRPQRFRVEGAVGPDDDAESDGEPDVAPTLGEWAEAIDAMGTGPEGADIERMLSSLNPAQQLTFATGIRRFIDATSARLSKLAAATPKETAVGEQHVKALMEDVKAELAAQRAADDAAQEGAPYF